MLSQPTSPIHLCNRRLPKSASDGVESVRLRGEHLAPIPEWLHDDPVCWRNALPLPVVSLGCLQVDDACVHSLSCHHRSHEAPFFRGLHRLAVHDSSTRTALPPVQYSQLGTEGVVEGLPHSAAAPHPEILVDCLPGRQVVRQHTPGATGSEQVEYGVGYLTCLVLTFASCMFRRWEQWLKQCPFRIVEVGRVRFACWAWPWCRCRVHALPLHHPLLTC